METRFIGCPQKLSGNTHAMRERQLISMTMIYIEVFAKSVAILRTLGACMTCMETQVNGFKIGFWDLHIRTETQTTNGYFGTQWGQIPVGWERQYEVVYIGMKSPK